MEKTTYTTTHEGLTRTRSSANAYTFAVWGRDTDANLEYIRRTDPTATAWGVIGFCSRRELADKTANKWRAQFAEIAIVPATPITTAEA